MKVPLSWLKEYIDLPNNPEKIAQTLTLAGLEVDGITYSGASFSGVVVAKIIKSTPVEGSDKLQLTEVFDGKESFQVVCGAPNCREDLLVPFAKIGASLVDPEGKEWKIRKTKIRGLESYGMLCGLEELGLEEKSAGVAELEQTLPLGTDFSSLYQEVVFDVSLTPNLGHCMSIYGIARELSAFLQIPINPLTIESNAPDLPFPFKISVDDPARCPRYCSLTMEGVEVGPSPTELAKKIELAGMRSINNVVDISNYVLLLTGQPLHFYDYDAITGKQITICALQKTEHFTTLDDEEKIVPPETLVIKDTTGILAIGGILGGKRGSITEKTKRLLIESALFHPSTIRKTMKALGIKTDASQRFEKGVDLEGQKRALFFAASLLRKYAGGKPSSSFLEIVTNPPTKKPISIRKQRVSQLLGACLSLNEISSLLKRLEMQILKESDELCEVLPPSYRNDLHEEIDLIEEIARLYGFNFLPKGRALHRSSPIGDSPLYLAEAKARQVLLQEGLQEFSTCDLLSLEMALIGQEHANRSLKPLKVLHAKSSDYSVLRTSLLPGLLQVIQYNLSHQNRDIAGFELGRVHFQENEMIEEPLHIGIILSGKTAPHHHSPKTKAADFFDLKGMVENVLSSFGITSASFATSHLQTFHPGRQARVMANGLFIGMLGEVHPSVLSSVGITQRVYFAELDLQELLQKDKKFISVSSLPTFPGSERDWTLTLLKKVPLSLLFDAIYECAPKLLETVYLLDLFEDEKIGIDKKNVTLRFTYRDKEKTIDLETVEAKHTKLIQNVAKKLDICIS